MRMGHERRISRCGQISRDTAAIAAVSVDEARDVVAEEGHVDAARLDLTVAVPGAAAIAKRVLRIERQVW